VLGRQRNILATRWGLLTSCGTVITELYCHYVRRVILWNWSQLL